LNIKCIQITHFVCEVFMPSSKKFLRKLVFWLLKNCENIVALLHYNNQTAAAVDYILFNFDNFSISNFVWTAMYGVKKSSFCSENDQRNKYICLFLKTKVCKTTTGFSRYEKFVFIFLVRKPI
jgi:hypothetical protein